MTAAASDLRQQESQCTHANSAPDTDSTVTRPAHTPIQQIDLDTP